MVDSSGSSGLPPRALAVALVAGKVPTSTGVLTPALVMKLVEVAVKYC